MIGDMKGDTKSLDLAHMGFRLASGNVAFGCLGFRLQSLGVGFLCRVDISTISVVFYSICWVMWYVKAFVHMFVYHKP